MKVDNTWLPGMVIHIPTKALAEAYLQIFKIKSNYRSHSRADGHEHNSYVA